MQGNPSYSQIMIATAAMYRILEEKDIVESQQEHSEREGLLASTMTGA